jgi:stearoyl-CoA desaturase (Delta-9 desaturase)
MFDLKYKGMKLKAIECGFLGYVHVVGLVGLVLLCLQEMDIVKKTLGFWIGLHIFGGFGITAGAHRLWAHKSYAAKDSVKWFLMIANSMAFQGSIFHWSRDHRLHHKFSDTILDPHSMERGFFFSHCGWLLVEKSDELVK